MNQKPYVVLVGIDFSELADHALQEALGLASRREDAEIHVLSVLPAPIVDPHYAVPSYSALDEGATLDASLQRLQHHVQLQLDGFAAKVAGPVLPLRVVYHVSIDTASHALVQLATDLHADLIVIGTHNRKGAERLLLGSVAEATVRRARCPVLVIPAEPTASKAEEVVKIEPPCAECVRAREASGGLELWCEQHRQRHGRRHTFHQGDRTSAASNFPLVFR